MLLCRMLDTSTDLKIIQFLQLLLGTVAIITCMLTVYLNTVTKLFSVFNFRYPKLNSALDANISNNEVNSFLGVGTISNVGEVSH